MIDHHSPNLWRSKHAHVRNSARAHQIARHLSFFLSYRRSQIFRHLSGGSASTLLELRDFSEDKEGLSIQLAEQLFTRNRRSIGDLQSLGLVENLQTSGIRWRLTQEGFDLAKSVEPLIEEVCSYC